jgi:hypothetical protein
VKTTRSKAIKALGALLLAVFCVSPAPTWARLPKPIQLKGIILAIDPETSALVFKTAKDKKPFVLDWDKLPEFLKDGQPVTPAALTNGATVVIHYKDLSF